MMSGIGLQMPFGEDNREFSGMGLKMPSKIDDDFIRILFVGVLAPAFRGGAR